MNGLPPGAVLVEIRDHGQAIALPPQEAALVAGSAEKRRRDFALGRAAARAALAGLGVADVIIGKGAGGAPSWPAGFVGSITHTRGHAAAIAGAAQAFRALGVDVEHIGGVTAKLAPRLFTDAEQAMLADFSDARWAQVATVLFSAKEAAYKCWHPLTGQVLDFRDVEVTLADGTFTAARSGGLCLSGCFIVRESLVLTAAWLMS